MVAGMTVAVLSQQKKHSEIAKLETENKFVFKGRLSEPPINNCNNWTQSEVVSYAFGREDEGTMLGDIEACLV